MFNRDPFIPKNMFVMLLDSSVQHVSFKQFHILVAFYHFMRLSSAISSSFIII